MEEGVKPPPLLEEEAKPTTHAHEECSQRVDVAVLPEEAWATLDAVDLSAELRRPVPTLQDVPPFMRAAVRRALGAALTRIRESSDPVGLPACRAWKLFLLALLARTDERGAQGRALLLARARAFEQGAELHEVLADGRWDRPPAASRVPPRQ